MRRQRFLVSGLVLLLSLLAAARAGAVTFSDVQFWVGDGPNQAAMIVDWNDGKSPEALLWGFRWDGNLTVGDMVAGIAGTRVLAAANTGAFIESTSGADDRLFVRLSRFGFGDSIFGFGYDLDGDGGSFTPGVEGAETGSASDADDHYAEGWANNGFWNSAVSTDGTTFGGFTVPGFALEDGTYYAWTFLPGFAGDGTPADIVAALPPGTNSPIPEPTTMMLGCMAFAAVGLRRKRAA